MASGKIVPWLLSPGDRVSIISPSFAIEEAKVTQAVRFLEMWGLEVVTGRNVLNRAGLFAGSDRERLEDIQAATDDSHVKAVFCSRGGYGMSRIIDRVDISSLRSYRKWYVGFSDITVLHLWLNEVCGVVSIHGEMPLNYGNSKKRRETFDSLHGLLFGDMRPVVWRGSSLRPVNTA